MSPLYFNETKQSSASTSKVQDGVFEARPLRVLESPKPEPKLELTGLFVASKDGNKSVDEEGKSAGASATISRALVEGVLPGDAPELDEVSSDEVHMSEYSWLWPSKRGGCCSMCCSFDRTWFRVSKSPSTNRIRQLFNMLYSLLSSRFSPLHIFP